MKKLICLSIFLLIFSFIACLKQQTPIEELSIAKKSLESDAVVQIIDLKRKDEEACIIDECAGTLCKKSTGNTCTKLHDCEPIPGGCLNLRADTEIESIAISHAQKLLNLGYISKDQVENTKGLVRGILKNQEKKITNN
jgi:hypothetical protein